MESEILLCMVNLSSHGGKGKWTEAKQAAPTKRTGDALL